MSATLNSGKQGSTLIVIILSIVAVGLVGTAMLTSTSSARWQRVNFGAVNRAQYLAESGRAFVLAQREIEPTFIPDGTYTLANGDQFILANTPGVTEIAVDVAGIANPGGMRETRRDLFFTLPLGSGDDEDPPFVDTLILSNIMVFGSSLEFAGSAMVGPNAAVLITGNMNTEDLNRGNFLNISTIMIDGNVELDGGSTALGSNPNPGVIFVNGNLTLWSGTRNVYGDVHVNGNFRIKDARIHNNVYVDGNVEIGWTPWLATAARVYYTGNVSHPGSMSTAITAKFIKVESIPGFGIPDMTIPGLWPDEWYTSRGYTSGGPLVNNMRVFADSYTSTGWRPAANNVVIVSRGDITITGLGGSGLTGFLYAPFGKVTFHGAFFQGSVVARDGLAVTSGGSTFTFRPVTDFISNTNDLPIPR